MTRLAYPISRTLTGQVGGGVSDASEKAYGGAKLTEGRTCWRVPLVRRRVTSAGQLGDHLHRSDYCSLQRIDHIDDLVTEVLVTEVGAHHQMTP